MGESTHLWPYAVEKDLALLPYFSSMNLACGFHAGDPTTMETLVEAALTAGVAVGAHPAYPDPENFGRTDMVLPPDKVYDIVLYQLGALQAFLTVRDLSLHHVKPHGALYNKAAADPSVATAICRAVGDFDPDLVIYGLAGSEMIRTAKSMGLITCSEIFADRSYQDNGQLTARSDPGALIEDPQTAVEQVLQLVEQQTVTSVNGVTIPVQADTICIHSDGTHALIFAQAISEALTQKGITIRHV